MKTNLFLFVASLFLTGCVYNDEVVVYEPVKIAKVELNPDSIHFDFKYKVYISKVDAPDFESDPVIYTDNFYSVGEELISKHRVQDKAQDDLKSLIDSLQHKDRMIYALTRRNDSLRNELKEKTLLIRFLTGK